MQQQNISPNEDDIKKYEERVAKLREEYRERIEKILEKLKNEKLRALREETMKQ